MSYNKFKAESIGEFFLSDPEFFKWTQQFGESHELFNSFLLIQQDNRTNFKTLLKKQNFCMLNSSHRRLYVWEIKLKHGTLWILTGKEHGTSYEWNNNTSESFRKDVKDYLTNLMEKLKGMSIN
jgi:hypothetical protein